MTEVRRMKMKPNVVCVLVDGWFSWLLQNVLV
jgi:hypothetical protein